MGLPRLHGCSGQKLQRRIIISVDDQHRGDQGIALAGDEVPVKFQKGLACLDQISFPDQRLKSLSAQHSGVQSHVDQHFCVPGGGQADSVKRIGNHGHLAVTGRKNDAVRRPDSQPQTSNSAGEYLVLHLLQGDDFTAQGARISRIVSPAALGTAGAEVGTVFSTVGSKSACSPAGMPQRNVMTAPETKDTRIPSR